MLQPHLETHGCRWIYAGAYIRGDGGGVGEDAMEAGVGRNFPGKHEAEDAEDAQLSRSCAGLIRVYFRKMRGVSKMCHNSLSPRSQFYDCEVGLHDVLAVRDMTATILTHDERSTEPVRVA